MSSAYLIDTLKTLLQKISPYFAALLIAGCASKQSKNYTDYETITKDETFRSGINRGNFAKLSDGYTYYQLANPTSDTILVMVHGFSVPSYIWDSTFNAAVKKGYSALRYDTYGRGFSDNPEVPYNVTLYSRQLKELLDTLAITKPITLLGLSDGGRTISAFAAQYPERIKNLVYVDAAGFNSLQEAESLPASVAEEEIIAFKNSDRYTNMAKGQLSDFYDSIPFRGWDKKYETIMQYKGFVRALISTNKNRTDLEKEHRQIAISGIPVFAIWGEFDTVVKLDEVRGNILNRLPEIKLFVIKRAGHLPHMEQAQEFNSILFKEIIQR